MPEYEKVSLLCLVRGTGWLSAPFPRDVISKRWSLDCSHILLERAHLLRALIFKGGLALSIRI